MPSHVHDEVRVTGRRPERALVWDAAAAPVAGVLDDEREWAGRPDVGRWSQPFTGVPSNPENSVS